MNIGSGNLFEDGNCFQINMLAGRLEKGFHLNNPPFQSRFHKFVRSALYLNLPLKTAVIQNIYGLDYTTNLVIYFFKTTPAKRIGIFTQREDV